MFYAIFLSIIAYILWPFMIISEPFTKIDWSALEELFEMFIKVIMDVVSAYIQM